MNQKATINHIERLEALIELMQNEVTSLRKTMEGVSTPSLPQGSDSKVATLAVMNFRARLKKKASATN